MIISDFDRVENIVGKGEITGYQHFLLFSKCFQKASFFETLKGVILWEWDKHFTKRQIFRPDEIQSICRRQIKPC